MPYYLIQKTVISKNLIHLTLDIVTRMPVTVNINTTSILEYSFHLVESSIEPGEIRWHTIFEYITKRSHFILISPDLSVVAIGEERRIDIDEVDRFRWDRA